QLLVKDAGFGANLLLNIGPMPNGEVQPEFTERLSAMGEWLKTYGATIYGTRGGFQRPAEWGAITEKGNKVYLHLFRSPGDRFFLKVPYKVKSAKLYNGGSALPFQALADNYVMIDLKQVNADPIDTVLELEVSK
ncbi:MAG TPA: alpha-L-fucosidase, partial [Puia sp.]|nr:alpha-L-fucosidase [Puia sp.]